MEKNACGIVSYAGLSKETLFSLGKAAFAQSPSPVPKRFDAFLPLFPIELVQNMDYIGPSDARGARVAPSGFSIDPVEYHRKLYAQIPELYAGDNVARNFDYEGRYTGKGVFTVDAVWVDHFPQYRPFLGEKLMIHLIGNGYQGVAVPECVYPRGGGVLEAAEAAMNITQHVELFVQYARARVSAGERYDAEAYQAEFLHTTGLTVLTLTQKEISRALQDLSIVKSLQNDMGSVGLYTENARQAERVSQYVPMRYACDLFTAEAVDKHTARLAQLYYADSDFVSDLWIPYQDFYAYVNRRTMTVDARRLCEGYQLAPRYDPENLCARYPDSVRVAVVRDRDLKLLVGEVINNPAYGDGMGPQGMIGKQVYIADSREMIRQRRLAPEEANLSVQNLTLPMEEYRRSLAQAVLQEHKGRLVDAMYRRETVLSQMDPGTPVYVKACSLLDDRVEKLNGIVKWESAQSGMSQMSGYDADIDYLNRKQRDREGEPEITPNAKPIAFARDAQREQSIESGYAMRAGLLRMMYQDAALPEPPPEQAVGADDSEEDAARELLPLIPATQNKEPAAAPGLSAASSASRQTVPGIPANTAPHGAVPGKAEQGAAETVAFQTSEANATRGSGAAAPQPDGSAGAVHPAENEPAAGMPMIRQGNAADGGVSPSRQEEAAYGAQALPEQNAGAASTEEAESDATAFTEAEDAPISPAFTEPDALPPHEGTPHLADESDADAGYATAPETDGERGSGPDTEMETEPDACEPEQSEPSDACDGADSAPLKNSDEPACDAPAHHRRVSLRELKDRCVIEPETPAEPQTAEPPTVEPPAEEPPKPKLAYILRRGSEETASKSFNRMSELLKRNGR